MRYVFFILFIFLFGCRDQEIMEEHDVFDLAVSGPVSAGEDRFIFKREVLLLGDSSNIQSSTAFVWTQLAGPEAEIENPFDLRTKVRNLSPGIYMFALSRTDGSETLSDTVVITVTI